MDSFAKYSSEVKRDTDWKLMVEFTYVKVSGDLERVSVGGEYIDAIVQGYFTQDSLVASKKSAQIKI